MSYWEFAFGWIIPALVFVWPVLSCFLAAIVVMGTVAACWTIADARRLTWERWILYPLVILLAYFLVALLAWSGTGAYA